MGNEINTLIEFKLAKVETYLQEAKVFFDDEEYPAAENRIYKAIFYMVSALALKNNFLSENHDLLKSWFEINFVKEKLIKKRHYRMYNISYKFKDEFNYDRKHRLRTKHIVKHLDITREFLSEIIKLIHGDTLTNMVPKLFGFRYLIRSKNADES